MTTMSLAIPFGVPLPGMSLPRMPFFQASGDYFVGVPKRLFMPIAAEQTSRNWCWAACVQMILNWHGVTVSQRMVVERIFGEIIDHPGGVRDMLEALSGIGPHCSGRTASLSARVADSNADIFDDLRDGELLIAGLDRPGQVGHAYVLVGATYDRMRDGSMRPASVILWNPSPNSGGWEEIPWRVFSNRCSCLVRCRVSVP